MIYKLKKFKLFYLFITFFLVLSLILGVVYFKYPNLTVNGLSLERSSADLVVEDEKLKVKFNITESDKQKVKKFSENLGISEEWSLGLELSLNKETIDKVKKITPAHVVLDIEDKQIAFKSNLLANLQSGLPTQSLNYSTGSAVFIVKGVSNEDFSLEARNLKDLLFDATASGKLQASPKLVNLFKLGERIDKIELKVHNKNINGLLKIK